MGEVFGNSVVIFVVGNRVIDAVFICVMGNCAVDAICKCEAEVFISVPVGI